MKHLTLRVVILVAALFTTFSAHPAYGQEPSVTAPVPEPTPLDSLCDVRLLPDKYRLAKTGWNIIQSCNAALNAPSPEVAHRLDRLVNDTPGSADKELIARCKQHVEDALAASAPVGDAGTEAPRQLAPADGTKSKLEEALKAFEQRWTRKYVLAYESGTTSWLSNNPFTELQYRLGLFCLTEELERAIPLPEALVANLRVQDALDVIKWLEVHQHELPPAQDANIKRVIGRKAVYERRLSTCPRAPDFFHVPSVISYLESERLAERLPEEPYRKAVDAFRRVYCETGHVPQLLNAARILASHATSDAEKSEAKELAGLVGKALPTRVSRDPLPYANQLEDLGHTWTKGLSANVKDSLTDYLKAVTIDDEPTDPHVAYLQYYVALVSERGSAAPWDAKRLKTAVDLADKRWASAACRGLENRKPLPVAVQDLPKILTCRAPQARPRPPCGPRMNSFGDVCCYEGMVPNDNGVCVGSCPKDMISDGGDGCVCREGMAPPSALTRNYCCWPGQGVAGDRCIGQPQCARGFERVGTSCWFKPPDATVCEQSDQGGTSWQSACFLGARMYLKEHFSAGADDQEGADNKNAGTEVVLNLYQKGCRGGSEDACLEGAVFAETVNPPKKASMKEMFYQLHSRKRAAGTFGYSHFVENAKQRAEMLDRPCKDSASYKTAGAVQACAWLATHMSSQRDSTKAIQLHATICEFGLQGASPISSDSPLISEKGRRLAQQRAYVRRSCETAVKHYKAVRDQRNWQTMIINALRALPIDAGWPGRSNNELRDEFSGQAADAPQWCGRPAGWREGMSRERWETHRCWRVREFGNENPKLQGCLKAEEYQEGGHGCPGQAGSPEEQLCCPVVADGVK